MSDSSQLSQPRLCFHTLGSPTSGFYSQVAMLRLSLDRLGGVYRQAQLIVTLGAEQYEPLPARWAPWYENIEIRWAALDEFREKSYLASANERWRYLPADCDFLIHCDADIVMLRPIDDLLEDLSANPAVGGAIAHSPFPQFPCETPAERWQKLADHFLGRPIDLDYKHTLGCNVEVSCPFYVNYGFVIFPVELFESLRMFNLSYCERIYYHLREPYYAGQVALALSVDANDTPARALPMRFNYPNDHRADACYPGELQDIRVMHYLRVTEFDRQKIFTEPESFDRFLELKLEGSNAVLQALIRDITGSQYPFPAL